MSVLALGLNSGFFPSAPCEAAAESRTWTQFCTIAATIGVPPLARLAAPLVAAAVHVIRWPSVPYINLPSRFPTLVPFRMRLFVALLLVNCLWSTLSVGGWRCGLAQEPNAPIGQSAPPVGTRQLLERAKQALQRNSSRIETVAANGRIVHLRYFQNTEQPVVMLDADVQVLYEAPRFRLDLQYVPLTEEDHADQTVLAAASQSNLEEQTVLFDGKTVITAERTRRGRWRGDIYFDFHKQNMLRMAGFPFEDPVTLWNEPLSIDRADLVAAQTTLLAGGGFMGVLQKETYRLKFFFLGDFDYDLRRVSSYRLNEDIPFRDWHVRWRQSQGVFFVDKLVRRNNEATNPGAWNSPSNISHDVVELEYHSVELNPAVEPGSFSVHELGLPAETPFYDHRVNVNGKPEVKVWKSGGWEPMQPPKP